MLDARAGASLAGSGKIWGDIGQFWAKLGKLRPTIAKFAPRFSRPAKKGKIPLPMRPVRRETSSTCSAISKLALGGLCCGGGQFGRSLVGLRATRHELEAPFSLRLVYFSDTWSRTELGRLVHSQKPRSGGHVPPSQSFAQIPWPQLPWREAAATAWREAAPLAIIVAQLRRPRETLLLGVDSLWRCRGAGRETVVESQDLNRHRPGQWVRLGVLRAPEASWDRSGPQLNPPAHRLPSAHRNHSLQQ